MASVVVAAGTFALYATNGVGVAPAAESVLSCTDTWTGNGGTTDWSTAGNWSAGVPDTTDVDTCIPGGATVVVSNASFSVGELTVAKDSTLAVGGGSTDGTPPAGAGLTVSSGLDNDGTLTAGPSLPSTPTLSLGGPITNTGVLEVDGGVTIGGATVSGLTNMGTVEVAPGAVIYVAGGSTLTNTSQGLLAFGIDGPPTSPSDYGRITNGPLALGGGVAPVYDNGFTPAAGTEYVVDDGTSTGTFATVLNGASVDYSHPGRVGLVGGAPVTATALSVTSSVTASVFGQAVQFTATVTHASGPDPTGSVSFVVGGVPLGSVPVATAAGVTTATLATSNLPVGTEDVTATYAGDVLFGPGTSAGLAQVVNPDSSDVTITAAPTNAVPGQLVTYSVGVAAGAPGAGSPAGTVSLTDDGSPITGCQSLALPSSGPLQVSCSQTYGSDATHAIVATYGGDADFSAASADATETVAPLPTTTSVTVSAGALTYGEAVSFAATVNPTAGDVSPTGSVTFSDNGATLGTSTLTTTDGVTTTSMLVTTLPLGLNSIVATYGGDIDSATSTSPGAPVTVSRAPTVLSLGSSDNPSIFGQPVTFTANVFPATGSGETGTVTFFANGALLGRGSVSDGQAAFTTSTLPVGTASVTASYSGDQDFAGATTATNGAWSEAVDPPQG